MDNGLARLISVDEAIDVLNRAEMDGLVHSPQNAQRPMGICNCCGCCCSVLRGITQLKLPPSNVVRSDYYCVCDPDACSGCGECTDRCQVEAIVLEGEVANINYNRCIGCGLCVSACPTDALKLVQKKTENLSKIPASVGEIFMMHVAEKAQYTGKS
jgi:ferredoxin